MPDSVSEIGLCDLRAEQEHVEIFKIVFLLEGFGDLSAHILFGHEVDLEMEFLQSRGCRRSHSREAASANVSQVLERFEEGLEEGSDAIGTREHEPVVAVESEQSLNQGFPVIGRCNLDGRDFKHIGPEVAKLSRDLTRLLASACDHDALTEQRTLLEPIQFVAQRNHIANDGDRRRGESCLLNLIGDGSKSRYQGLLTGCRSPTHHRHGGGCGLAFSDEALGERANAFDAHEDHFGSRDRSEPLQIQS